MPFRQSSFSEGRDGSPFSAGPSSINPYGYGTNGVDPSNGNVNGNGYFSPPTDGQATPPIDMYSEKPVSRKRSYNRAESSSDEEETPKRRQEDDFTPKLKKRQPKVAAAYR